MPGLGSILDEMIHIAPAPAAAQGSRVCCGGCLQ